MNLLTNTQRKVAQAIVNVFETSSVQGDYGKVTLIPGDTGQLTYGRSQTTLASGNLHKLIAAYVPRLGARFGESLAPFLPALQARDSALNENLHFHNLLRASADDVVMRDPQDEFFDEEYWESAVRIAERDGIETPLGVAVVYDSRVHGSWTTIRRRVNDALGIVADVGEKTWIPAYVEERHGWLAGHRNPVLRLTVYRMEVFRDLIEQDAWLLEMPLVVRRQEIEPGAFCVTPPHVYDGPEPRSREILVTSPILRGLDVRLVQLALSTAGHSLQADGIFGGVSRANVKAFQEQNGLPVTGIVASADFDALGL